MTGDLVEVGCDLLDRGELAPIRVLVDLHRRERESADLVRQRWRADGPVQQPPAKQRRDADQDGNGEIRA